MYANRGLAAVISRNVTLIVFKGIVRALAENYDSKRVSPSRRPVSYERSEFSFRSPLLDAHLSGGVLSPQGAITGPWTFKYAMVLSIQET